MIRHLVPMASRCTSQSNEHWRLAQLNLATQGNLRPATPSRDRKNLGENWPAPRTPSRPNIPSHAGVYAADKGILAVNRAEAEDRPAVLSDSRVAELFRGLDFDRVDDQAGNMKSLAREVWRMCVGGMLVAIVIEAGLCLPRPPRQKGNIS